MKCLRSGYCCIHYDVIIVDDPTKGISDGNVKHKPTGVRCQHLKGDGPGQYSCALHNEPWYNQTPCYDYDQISQNPDAVCRTGARIIASIK